MTSPAYVVMMARYNAWQNNQLIGIFDAMHEAELYKDQGAFFGSIMATVNHIHWGDRLWMNRFGMAVAAPTSVPQDWATYTTSAAEWAAARLDLDAQILTWARGLTAADLETTITWRSALYDKDFVDPMGLCVAHVFNHQTHHRGQVHAMLTASGQEAPVTDIPFMPEDA